jgi:hypothetical protein
MLTDAVIMHSQPQEPTQHQKDGATATEGGRQEVLPGKGAGVKVGGKGRGGNKVVGAPPSIWMSATKCKETRASIKAILVEREKLYYAPNKEWIEVFQGMVPMCVDFNDNDWKYFRDRAIANAKEKKKKDSAVVSVSRSPSRTTCTQDPPSNRIRSAPPVESIRFLPPTPNVSTLDIGDRCPASGALPGNTTVTSAIIAPDVTVWDQLTKALEGLWAQIGPVSRLEEWKVNIVPCMRPELLCEIQGSLAGWDSNAKCLVNKHFGTPILGLTDAVLTDLLKSVARGRGRRLSVTPAAPFETPQSQPMARMEGLGMEPPTSQPAVNEDSPECYAVFPPVGDMTHGDFGHLDSPDGDPAPSNPIMGACATEERPLVAPLQAFCRPVERPPALVVKTADPPALPKNKTKGTSLEPSSRLQVGESKQGGRADGALVLALPGHHVIPHVDVAGESTLHPLAQPEDQTPDVEMEVVEEEDLVGGVIMKVESGDGDEDVMATGQLESPVDKGRKRKAEVEKDNREGALISSPITKTRKGGAKQVFLTEYEKEIAIKKAQNEEALRRCFPAITMAKDARDLALTKIGTLTDVDVVKAIKEMQREQKAIYLTLNSLGAKLNILEDKFASGKFPHEKELNIALRKHVKTNCKLAVKELDGLRKASKEQKKPPRRKQPKRVDLVPLLLAWRHHTFQRIPAALMAEDSAKQRSKHDRGKSAKDLFVAYQKEVEGILRDNTGDTWQGIGRKFTNSAKELGVDGKPRVVDGIPQYNNFKMKIGDIVCHRILGDQRDGRGNDVEFMVGVFVGIVSSDAYRAAHNRWLAKKGKKEDEPYCTDWEVFIDYYPFHGFLCLSPRPLDELTLHGLKKVWGVEMTASGMRTLIDGKSLVMEKAVKYVVNQRDADQLESVVTDGDGDDEDEEAADAEESEDDAPAHRKKG